MSACFLDVRWQKFAAHKAHGERALTRRAPPCCRLAWKQVGKWTMLVDQLFSIRDVAPSGCQPAYLITEVLFLAMLQVSFAGDHFVSLLFACVKRMPFFYVCGAVRSCPVVASDSRPDNTHDPDQPLHETPEL